MKRYEICAACGCATGHAGYGEDSIGYVDGMIGPLCDECNQRLRLEIDCENEENERLRDELAAAREQLREQTKSFCTHCGKLFPKGTDGIEQFRAHIAECNSHPLQPLAQELAAARELLRVVLAVVQYHDIRFPGRNQWLAEAAAAAGGEK